MFAREPVEEVLDERRDVLAALAQRRHGQVDDVEPVEQVLAERALRDHVAQVAVGRGDDADVDAAAGAIGADLLQLAGLEEAQQQALHAQRHLADFVEEDRAAVGHLELARLVAIGAGEAALDVAEQLRLEQRLGQAGAVDGDEVVVLARAVGVHRPRDEFLADAALAGDEHLGVGLGDALDFLAQIDQERAGTNQKRGLVYIRSHSDSQWAEGFRNDSSARRLPSSSERKHAPISKPGRFEVIAVRRRLQQTRTLPLKA